MPPSLPEVRVLDPLPIDLPRPLVLLRLGYRSATQVPAKTAGLLDGVLEAARPKIAPRAVCAAFDVARDPDGALRIGGRLVTSSRSLRERLEGCATAVLFAATIGPDLEEWVRTLDAGGEITRALLADAVGSAAAIALGTAFEAAVVREFHDLGLLPTKRYAPGYGDFELECQTPLMAMVEAHRIGIAITEDHLMLPGKSISGVVGGRG
ncbi:MAG TPA: hypothetical protein VJV75_06830 [Candidatus Polarisedimenticolia bacterium]|nr:hypothetical protein [Candidatus Polarisedimenticolia bacterium]